MSTDPRPELIKQLAHAREIFSHSNKHDSEEENAKILLIFFHKHKFLTTDKAEFARKLIKLSQTVRQI